MLLTEKEWQKSTDPMAMLEFTRDTVSDRKLRLLACACCRRIWHLLSDENSRKGIELAERYADGKASDEELRVFNSTAWIGALYSLGRSAAAIEAAAEATFQKDAFGASYHVSLLAYNAYYAVGESRAEYAAQTHLLRDIFGNPFYPVAPDPAWLATDVLALARGIYEDRAFDRLPIVADALEDAGCDNAAALSHCRDTGATHVRGCWVVDLLLGKA